MHWGGAGQASTFNWVNLSEQPGEVQLICITPVRGRTEGGC